MNDRTLLISQCPIDVVYISQLYFKELDTRFKFIDESKPAVMINLTDFAMIVGIESTALKEVRHPNVVSVIDSFTFANDTVKLNFKRYLKDDFCSEIQFKIIDQLKPDCLITQGKVVAK